VTAEEVVRRLGLRPMEREGGWFAETWRAEEPGVHRSIGTAIYYLITPESFSEMHRLPGAEIFHFYLGDPAEMLMLEPGGGGRVVTLGSALESGMTPQRVVPGGVWQGTRLAPGGAWALMGTTMAPGFDPADYERGPRAALSDGWPRFRREIELRTRD
jgi:uncharacterized protein